ncbi:MAG: hypothetical protein ACP6IY_16675 [Promethearchaeia archaeon]
MSIKANILEKFINKLKEKKSIPIEIIDFMESSFNDEKMVKKSELKKKLEAILNDELNDKKN